MTDHPTPARPDLVRQLGAAYMLVQGLGALGWWAMLLTLPATRGPFLAPGAPDATLLAFMLPDLVLFAGASLVAALGLWRGARWTWPVLIAQAAASAYAELYCLNLMLLTGGAAWLGAVLMAPSVVVPPWLVWRLRPRREGPA